jgi:hypothetical protein
MGRHLLSLTVLVALLLLSATAMASTTSLKGTVPGDANAVVSMKIVKVRGTPQKAKRIVFRNLDHRCSDGSVRDLTVRLGQSRISKVGITAKYTFFDLISPPNGFLIRPRTLRHLQFAV